MPPIIEWIIAIISVVGTIWTIATYFLPSFQEYKKNNYWEKNLGKGPYDDDTIQEAIKFYIRPKYSRSDPSIEIEPRESVLEGEDLFKAVDLFLLKDPKRRHLFILADSGMGKTSFVLNYYVYNTRLPASKKQKFAIVPLGIPDADEWISKAASSGVSVVILDGLDEDVGAINNFEKRFDDLMKKCHRFKKVILTCRTQFFPNESQIPLMAGIPRIGPVSAGEKKDYDFERYFLLPFNDDEVKQYLKNRFRSWNSDQREKAFELVRKIPLLSVRPMLLAHIPDLLEVDEEFICSYQIYEAMVNAWMEHESSKNISKTDLRKFSDHIAVDLYINRGIRETERIPYEQLSQLAEQWNIRIEEWKLSSRSLLNRDSDGNYKFAHRSIMEFLFVRQLIENNEKCFGVQLTDQMIVFLQDMLGFRVAHLEKHHVIAVSSSILVNMVLHEDFQKINFNDRLGRVVVSTAKGLAWNKISSALFLAIDREIRQSYPSDNYFSVSDWRIVEEKLVSSAVDDKSEKEKTLISRHLRDFLMKIPTTFTQSTDFGEAPDVYTLIARNWALEVLESGISYDELEPKLCNFLKDNSIYFWGEKFDDWNLWYRFTLLHFMIQFGNTLLQDVLTIKKNVLLVPLFNDIDNKFEGLAIITK